MDKSLMVYKWLGLITYNLQVGPSKMEWLVGWTAEHLCLVVHAKYVVDDDFIKQTLIRKTYQLKCQDPYLQHSYLLRIQLK